jgi:hypothetical protein
LANRFSTFGKAHRGNPILNKEYYTFLLTGLLNPINLLKMNYLMLEIPRLGRETNVALNALFPKFEEKDFKFDLTASRPDHSTVVWFLRVSDRRRYSLTLGWNGFLRLRRYDNDDTRIAVFESREQSREVFEDLEDAFEMSEAEWEAARNWLPPLCPA